MRTYDEHKKLNIKRQAKSDTQDDIHKIKLAMQAAVSAELLTKDENWDVYLQSLQYAIEMIQKGIEARKAQLEDPRTVDQNLLMQLKISLADLQGQLLALEWAIGLPNSIKSTGKLARKLHDNVPEFS